MLPGWWPIQKRWQGHGRTWPGSWPLCLCQELAGSPLPSPEPKSDDLGSTASTAESKTGDELRASEFLCVP